MDETTKAQRSRPIGDHYTSMINALIADGRDELIAALTEEYDAELDRETRLAA